jgi:hypothetical protein
VPGLHSIAGVLSGNRIHWTSAQLARLESTKLTGLPGKRGNRRTAGRRGSRPGNVLMRLCWREGERRLTTRFGPSTAAYEGPHIDRQQPIACVT